MRPVLSVAEVRALEAGRDEAALIRRAGFAVAVRTADLLGGGYGRRVAVLAGSGHNGADALRAGAELARRGAAVTATLVGREGDGHWSAALAALRAAGGGVGPAPSSADAVVDGVVGVGYRPGRPLTVDVPAAPLVVAVDVPSGVDADTGEVGEGAVRADVTVTFSALKPGLLLARDHCGLVEVVDLGLPPPPVATAVLDADDVGALLPALATDTHKYRRGVVGVVAGSDTYPGAALLACAGALRVGVGMVRLYAPAAVADLVRARLPEVVAAAGRVDAWVVGPGLGAPRDLPDGPAVVDADAIVADALRGRTAPTLATPHAGELRRLTAAAPGPATARDVARDLGVTVLLKGATTVVAAPDGSTRLNPTGTPLLATAGTGDVLAGVCGALLAAGLTPLDAGAAGAFLHGLAAGLHGGPLSAWDVAEALPAAVRAVALPHDRASRGRGDPGWPYPTTAAPAPG